MADESNEEELLSVTDLSKGYLIGQTNNYVVEQYELSNNAHQTIDLSRTTDRNQRVAKTDTIYANSSSAVGDLTLGDNPVSKSTADLNSTSSFLPRLVFLDSDEHIPSKVQSQGFDYSDNPTENRERRSVSDSVVRVNASGDRITSLNKQPQGASFNTGYTNRLSQVSVQSSDSDLLIDHNVMDVEHIPVNNMTHVKGHQQTFTRDDDWHCHFHTMKIPPDKMARNQLIIVSILCFVFMVGEAVGGALSNSLALFTDVLHLGSDLISFLVSLLALYLSKKPATRTMSFGYHRAEVLGALMSVFIIWSVTGVLLYMAVERIINKHYVDVKADEMLITAVLGVVFNFVMGIVLHSEICCKGSGPSFGHNHSHGNGHSHGHGPSRDSYHSHTNHVENHSNHNNTARRSYRREDEAQEPLLDSGQDMVQIDSLAESEESHEENSHPKNINVRAAFIHVLGDIIQSIGVLVSSLIIKFKPEEKYRLADPICTFLFSILVLLTTITVLRDTLQIIMEGVPRDINYYSIKSSLQKIDGVVSIHGLSVWCLTLEKNALSVHIVVDPSVNQKKVLQEASEYLHRNYSFLHTTIQVEDHTHHTAQCSNCQELHK